MTRGRLLAAAYVASVAALTAIAFIDEDHERWWARVAVAVLCLPTMIPALPAIYVGGAVAWSLADDPSSGSASSADPWVGDAPMWPVALAFTAMTTAVAIANVWVLRTAWPILPSAARRALTWRSAADDVRAAAAAPSRTRSGS